MFRSKRNLVTIAQKKSLSEELFYELLLLESYIYEKKPQKHIIERLIEIYAQIVEYYDALNDCIKMYFVEKMQLLTCYYDGPKLAKASSNSLPEIEEKIGKGESVKLKPLFSHNKEIYTKLKSQKIDHINVRDILSLSQEEINTKVERIKTYFQVNLNENNLIIREALNVQESVVMKKIEERKKESLSNTMRRNIDDSFNRSLRDKFSLRSANKNTAIFETQQIYSYVFVPS